MTRQTRTLLLLGGVAILGLTALALMAQRYGRIASTRGEPITPAADHGAAPPPPPTAGVPAPAPPPPARGGMPSPATRQVEAFVSVRSAIRETMDKHPAAMQSMLAELEGKTGSGKVKMYTGALLDLRAAKERALAAAGISRKTYDRVRESYRARVEGRPAPDAELDAALAAAGRRVEAASLGSYERLDF